MKQLKLDTRLDIALRPFEKVSGLKSCTGRHALRPLAGEPAANLAGKGIKPHEWGFVP